MVSAEKSVVIVTGASSGIGEATVRRLVRRGAWVVCSARRAERLERLQRDCDPAKNHTVIVPADITVEDDRKNLVRIALERSGRIDALVNNAGFGQRGPLEIVSVDAIRRNFETNVFSLIALTQLVIPVMRAQHAGRIVNVSSVAGKIARPLSSVYDGTKHALEALSDGLRGELAPFGIQVVVIRPGFILTEFIQAADAVSAPVVAELGPYAPFLGGFRGSSQHLRRVAAEPDVIARLIERGLFVRHPKTHYAGPAHAKLFLFLKWLLPSKAIDRVVRLRRT